MKNTTTIKIPKKYHIQLELVEHDSDGYWAYSEYGYMFADMECHTAHEDTHKDLLRVIRSLEPCDCQECIEELKKKNKLESDNQMNWYCIDCREKWHTKNEKSAKCPTCESENICEQKER